MRRVLVLGSAGFLMSNLMRYMLYRTKEYEFFSVDRLDGNADYRNVYQNRKHSFHIGDAGNAALVDKLVEIVDPSVLVVGTSTTGASHVSDLADIAMPTAAACDSSGKRLVIRIVPDDPMGKESLWKHTETMVLETGGTVLKLPVCFGRRGNGEFEKGLRRIIAGQTEGWKPDTRKVRYAYAEDVASVIWFLMEYPRRGVVRMPALATTSAKDLIAMTASVHGYECGCWTSMEDSEEHTLDGWEPDSKSIEEAASNTAKWYTMNKWVFGEH